MDILKTLGLCSLLAGTGIAAGCGGTSPTALSSFGPSAVSTPGATSDVVIAPHLATASALTEADTAAALGTKGTSGNGRGGSADNRRDVSNGGPGSGANTGEAGSHPPPVTPPSTPPTPSVEAEPVHELELEGLVTAVDLTGSLQVNGRTVLVPAGVLIRHGQTALTLAQVLVGDRVHVNATRPLVATDPPVASEVNVQRSGMAGGGVDDLDEPPPVPAPDDVPDLLPVSIPAGLR